MSLFNLDALNAISNDTIQGSTPDGTLASWEVAEEYIRKGWTAPFPLPEGQKSPPIPGVTGGVPRITPEKIQELWEGVEGANIALRLQAETEGSQEIISIDIDNYGTKRGDEHLSELEAQLGSLNRDSSWRSSRRGIKNPSGQVFFRVPPGLKWPNSVCADVDLVQMGHRYSVVWPSVSGDSQYKWISPEGVFSDAPPYVKDLPEMPEAWVTHLTNGVKRGAYTAKSHRSAFTGSGSDKYRAAIDWLRLNLPGWVSKTSEDGSSDKSSMSNPLAKVSSGEKFLNDIQNNGHDTMVSAVHSAIRLGVEGHAGVKVALGTISDRFYEVVVEGQRRSRTSAEAEFERAVVGEVERVREEIETGDLTIFQESAEFALGNLSDLIVSAESERKPQGITRLSSYGDNDFDNARIYASYWGTDVLVDPNAEASKRFARWSSKMGRFTFSSRGEMYNTVAIGLAQRLKYEAEQRELEVMALEEKAAKGQITEEESDMIESLQAMADNLNKRSSRLLNTPSMNHVLDQLSSIDEIKVSALDFDSIGDYLGVAGGKTLDLSKEAFQVRDSEKSDMLTMSTRAIFQKSATHPNWDKFLESFLPDPTLRRFVQKVMGYSLVDGNPEKIIVFLFGPNHTGKTTILEAIGSALGDYASPINAVKLLGRNTGGPNSEVLANVNKRMVFMSEIGTDYELSANSLKQVTGNDSQQLRGVHSAEVIAKTPSFTPYVATNSIPSIQGGDEALSNRLLIIPFDKSNKFSVKKEESIFSPMVYPAIFWWLLEGFQMYKEEGLSRDEWPEIIQDTSKKFSGEISPVHEFASRHLAKVSDKKAIVLREEVDMAWKTFTVDEGIPIHNFSLNEFHKTLKSLGFASSRTTVNGTPNRHVYRGVQLTK